MRPTPLASVIATDGLWLIGLGAFLVAVTALTTQPPRLHLQFGGLGDQRKDRLASAITTTGLLATAAGSILVAVGSTPAGWFIAVAFGALLMSAWGLMARQVRLLWLARRNDTAMRLRENQDLAREAWELEATIVLARWRWVLLHPLTPSNANSWPTRYLARKIGDAPPGIPAEWYSNEGRQLRYSQPNLVRMTADGAPGWLRDIVVVALAEGWLVLGAPSFISFYTPNGLQYETVTLDQPAIVHLLVRRNLLNRLKRLGLPTHRGGRGQALPGCDTDELIRRLVEADQATLCKSATHEVAHAASLNGDFGSATAKASHASRIVAIRAAHTRHDCGDPPLR